MGWYLLTAPEAGSPGHSHSPNTARTRCPAGCRTRTPSWAPHRSGSRQSPHRSLQKKVGQVGGVRLAGGSRGRACSWHARTPLLLWVHLCVHACVCALVCKTRMRAQAHGFDSACVQHVCAPCGLLLFGSEAALVLERLRAKVCQTAILKRCSYLTGFLSDSCLQLAWRRTPQRGRACEPQLSL